MFLQVCQLIITSLVIQACCSPEGSFWDTMNTFQEKMMQAQLVDFEDKAKCFNPAQIY